MKTYNFKSIDAIPEDFVYSYAPFAPDHKKFSFKPFGTINYDTENFEKFDYDYTYRESEGTHCWKFWDEYIQYVLNWMFGE